MSRCPECAGKMEFQPGIKRLVCSSCGLSLTRNELETYWKKIKSQNVADTDELSRKKQRKKEWLEWYSSSKSEKSEY